MKKNAIEIDTRLLLYAFANGVRGAYWNPTEGRRAIVNLTLYTPREHCIDLYYNYCAETIATTTTVYSKVIILQLSELEQCGVNKTVYGSIWQQELKPEFSQLRVQCPSNHTTVLKIPPSSNMLKASPKFNFVHLSHFKKYYEKPNLQKMVQHVQLVCVVMARRGKQTIK